MKAHNVLYTALTFLSQLLPLLACLLPCNIIFEVRVHFPVDFHKFVVHFVVLFSDWSEYCKVTPKSKLQFVFKIWSPETMQFLYDKIGLRIKCEIVKGMLYLISRRIHYWAMSYFKIYHVQFLKVGMS